MKPSARLLRFLHLVTAIALVAFLLVPTTAFADNKAKPSTNDKQAQSQQKIRDDDAKKAQAQQRQQQEREQQERARQERERQQERQRQQEQARQQQQREQQQREQQQLQQQRAASQQASKGGQSSNNRKDADDTNRGKTQGDSCSNPDGGGIDKPFDCGAQRANTQANPQNAGRHLDGNNGCGQDKKVEPREDGFGQKHQGWDDNNGWCGRPHDNDDQDQTPAVAPKRDNDDRDDRVKEVRHEKSCNKNDDDDDTCSPAPVGNSFNPAACPSAMASTEAKEWVKVEQFSPFHATLKNHHPRCAFVAGVALYVIPRGADQLDDQTVVAGSAARSLSPGESSVWSWPRASCREFQQDAFVGGVITRFNEGSGVIYGSRKLASDRFDTIGPACQARAGLVNARPVDHVKVLFAVAGCFLRPSDQTFVFFHGATFDTEGERDLAIVNLVFQHMDQATCWPKTEDIAGVTKTSSSPPISLSTISTTSTTPAPPSESQESPAPSASQPVTMYGCYHRPDGTVIHINRQFASQAEKDTFERENGLTVDASRPNPDQCRDVASPAQSASFAPPPAPPAAPPFVPALVPTIFIPAAPPAPMPPGGVAGITTEDANPSAPLYTIAVIEAPQDVTPLAAAPVGAEAPAAAPPGGVAGITSEEFGAESAPASVPPSGVLGVVSDVPAAPAAPAQPTSGMLPTTGQPLVDLGLLTLGFVGLTLLGLRLLRTPARGG